MRPRPKRGQGRRKGGDLIFEKRFSYKNRIFSDRIIGVETPKPPIMIYASSPDGAPPRRIND
jgi:hypothetical protein